MPGTTPIHNIMTLWCQLPGFIQQMHSASTTECVCANSDTTAADSANGLTLTIPTYTYRISKTDTDQQIKKHKETSVGNSRHTMSTDIGNHPSAQTLTQYQWPCWSAEKSMTTHLQPQQALSTYTVSAQCQQALCLSRYREPHSHDSSMNRDDIKDTE